MRKYFLTIILIISFIFVCPVLLQAQKKKTVNGESQIRVEAHLSENTTKEKAIEQAKINAIRNEYGEYVEQESDLVLNSGRVDFRSYGQIKVKGEWIRTIGVPEFKYFNRDTDNYPERWISCKIRGEVRKTVPKANIEVETLSGPGKDFRKQEFLSDENMYMYVRSPIDGYLSVYLDDGNRVYRLLPYRRMGAEKSVEIKGDQEYILFSADIKNFDTLADQIELFTNDKREINTLIIVFAESEYQKPILFNETVDVEGYISPRSLSKTDFEVWLGENRAAFTDFLDIKRQIVIRKR